ncbi:MAG: GDSL-type esterase/lipase family protein [Gemmatimonadota bacterium]
MPTKKSRWPKSRRASTRDQSITAAIAGGREAAAEVIAFRTKQRRKRAAIERKTAVKRRRAPRAAPRISERVRALLGPKPSSGVLIAEGDSWFDYPFHDVLQQLEDDYLFDVESVAHKGDCVEDIAHSAGQFEEFARRLEKLLRDGKMPRAILLSGGGNDIAGDEFAILLNHATSSLPPLNEDIVRGVIDVRLRAAYARIISGITAVAKSYLTRPIPIITHGYDYPVPDGRGFFGGFSVLPGPWLKPGFTKKGYKNAAANQETVAALIDRFNDMLVDVSAHPQFAHVHYLDLRKTLKRGTDYKTHWENELHPNERGFRLVTKKFADLIAQL